MRYHYDRPKHYSSHYGEEYVCDHPVYSKCTLFRVWDRGLAVIQQRYDPGTKRTYWGPIDPWLTDPIYLNPAFLAYFKKRSDEADETGCYPTVTVRQIMWALKMKPIPKEVWETVFDRAEI